MKYNGKLKFEEKLPEIQNRIKQQAYTIAKTATLFFSKYKQERAHDKSDGIKRKTRKLRKAKIKVRERVIIMM